MSNPSSASASASASAASVTKKMNESLNVVDLQAEDSTTAYDEDESSCFRPGIGDQSFTSFEEQMRVAQKREALRRKKEMEQRLGGSSVSLKERMKMFEKKQNASAST
jgi:hypothetical protein